MPQKDGIKKKIMLQCVKLPKTMGCPTHNNMNVNFNEVSLGVRMFSTSFEDPWLQDYLPCGINAKDTKGKLLLNVIIMCVMSWRADYVHPQIFL